MENEIKVNNDSLSQSYSGGVQRIVGLKNYTTFQVPPELIKQRQQFWNQFFDKYSNELPHDTEFNILTLKPIRRVKSSNFVQYWVDTGYLPYRSSMNENYQSESTEKLNSNESSSSTSVDTAAYILSNMNTTNKEETMAIVEGAKPSTLSSDQNANCDNTKTTQFMTNEILDKNSENISSVSSATTKHLVQQEHNNLKEHMQMQANLNTNTNENISEEVINRNNTTNCDLERELFKPTLVHTVEDNRYNNLEIIQNLTKRMHIEDSFWIDGNSTLQNTTSKLSHRKKLYSGRNSPVDIVHMRSSNKSAIFKSTRMLHPALDTKCKLTKKCKVFKKRRTKSFHSLDMNVMNNSKPSFSKSKRRKKRNTENYVINTSLTLSNSNKNESSSQRNIVNNLNEKQSLMTSSNKQCMDIFSSNDKSMTRQSSPKSKPTDPVVQIEKPNKQHEKSNGIRKQLTHLQPRIGLRRLSKNIQIYEKPKQVVTYKNLNPIVYLKQLSEFDIQKYKKPNKAVVKSHNLEPVVYLKRLSESDIQKHKQSNKTVTKLCNSNSLVYLKNLSKCINPVVYLQKLSKSDLENYTVPTVQTQHHDTIEFSYSKVDSDNTVSKNRTVDLTEDTDSDQSTLLLYECRSYSSQDYFPINNSFILNKNSQISLEPIETCNNPNLRNKKKLNSSDLHKKSKVMQNELLRNAAVDILTNTFQKQNSENRHAIEVPYLNKEKYPEVTLIRRSPRKSQTQNVNTTPVSNKLANKDNKTKYQTRNLLFSDGDNEFMELINSSNFKSKSNSRRNSNDSVHMYVTEESGLRNRTEIKDVMNDKLETTENSGKNIVEQKQHSDTVKNVSTLLVLSEKKDMDRVIVENSNLTTTKKMDYALNKAKMVLRSKKGKKLTNVSTKRGRNQVNSNPLHFQTRIFDSDSESSSYV